MISTYYNKKQLCNSVRILDDPTNSLHFCECSSTSNSPLPILCAIFNLTLGSLCSVMIWFLLHSLVFMEGQDICWSQPQINCPNIYIVQNKILDFGGGFIVMQSMVHAYYYDMINYGYSQLSVSDCTIIILVS